MKVKVLKKFRDKNTGIIHKPTEIIEVSETRLAEILKTGPFVQEMEEPTEEQVETEEKPKKAAKKKKK